MPSKELTGPMRAQSQLRPSSCSPQCRKVNLELCNKGEEVLLSPEKSPEGLPWMHSPTNPYIPTCRAVFPSSMSSQQEQLLCHGAALLLSTGRGLGHGNQLQLSSSWPSPSPSCCRARTSLSQPEKQSNPGCELRFYLLLFCTTGRCSGAHRMWCAGKTPGSINSPSPLFLFPLSYQ